MLNVRVKPQARPPGSRCFVIKADDDSPRAPGGNPFADDDDDSPTPGGNPFIAMTPGSSDHGSAFRPVSPPKIERRVPRAAAAAANDGSTKLDLPRRKPSSATTSYHHGKSVLGSPCDKTAAMSLHSLETFPSGKERQKKDGTTTTTSSWLGTNAAMKNQIMQMKLNIPKAMKAMNIGTTRNKIGAVDLADLAVAAICVVPRHGAGIAVGRMPFERVRTSLMMHMIQENQNAPWSYNDVGDDNIMTGGENPRKGKAQIAKLNALLRNCIADEGSCFVEKSQEAVKLAKNTLEVSVTGYYDRTLFSGHAVSPFITYIHTSKCPLLRLKPGTKCKWQVILGQESAWKTERNMCQVPFGDVPGSHQRRERRPPP
jgi:hypothetical protein